MKQYFKIFLAMLIIEFGSALCAGAKFDHNATNLGYQSLMANPDEENPLPPDPILYSPMPQDTLIINGKLVIVVYGQ